MNRRLQNWLLSLYPRRWRDRYGHEVGSLTDELIDAGETTPMRAGFDLTFSAATERGRALGESWRALGRRRVLAMATAFAMLLVLGFALSSHQVMRGSSAMTISCQTNFIKVNRQGQPPGRVTGRLIRANVWTGGTTRQRLVVVAEAKAMCGPPGFACLTQVPMPPKLRVVAGPKPAWLQVGQAPPSGKLWTVHVPSIVEQCAMSVHAKTGGYRVYKPGPPPPQQKKKRVPQQSKK